MNLENKTALVTGASRGIGRAIALRLASEGARVAVHYHQNEDAARAVAEEITVRGGQAQIFRANIAAIADTRALVESIEGAFGPIELLINNAGQAEFARLHKATEDQYDATFALNTKGVFFLTQAATQRMPDGGRIVLISSGITRANVPGGSTYAGSKAAIESFARCWAAEFGPRQITVNVVSPGMTETDLLTASTPSHALENFVAQTPLGRLGQPADIADVVAFLCSDDARWMTANNLLANGGAT